MQRTLCGIAGVLCAVSGHAAPVRTDAHAVMRDNTIIISSQLNGYTPDEVMTTPRTQPPVTTAPGSVPLPPRNPFSSSANSPVAGSPRTPGAVSRGVTVPLVPKPVATAPVTPPAPVTPAIWLARKGDTLKDTLLRWTRESPCRGTDWTVIWFTPVNYHIDAPLQFSGDFRAALTGIFTLYKTADKPLFAVVNTHQCVIQVTDRRDG